MIFQKIANKTGQYTLLLGCLLIALITMPILEHFHIGRLIIGIWSLLTIATLVRSLRNHRRHFISTSIIGGCLFVLIIAQLIALLINQHSKGFYLFIIPVGMLFIIYCIWMILSSIFKKKNLSADELSGAIVTYILMGILWGALYIYIEILSPGSFNFTVATDPESKVPALVYYSFVTLTTLGFGDILPLNTIARVATYLEALTGVMYTAILVAGLVGHLGNHRQSRLD